MSSRFSLDVQVLRIPLRMPVSHASHTRAQGESIAVRARRGACEGVGEGCPRPYVTGEDTETSLAWLRRHEEALARVGSVDALEAFASAHAREIDACPGAWCAAESALLDVFARERGSTVEALLGVEPRADPVEMTAVLFDAPPAVFDGLVERHRQVGFRDWKLRVSGHLEEDRARLERVRQAGARRVRVDGNNRWRHDPDAGRAHLAALHAAAPLAAVEEPCAPRDVAALSRIATELGVPVILDESACTPADLRRFDEAAGSFIVNVKVSKAGGLQRALALVAAARERQWPVVVGAQVGETSILTRLAMIVASVAGDALWACEGGYGTLLLERDPVEPELRFGAGGRLAPPPAAPGLGLAWKPDAP